MKLKIFKPAILLAVLLAVCNMCFTDMAAAQTDSVTVIAKVNKALQLQLHELAKQLNQVSATAYRQLNAALKDADMGVNLNGLIPQVSVSLNGGGGRANDGGGRQGIDAALVKNYSKTYPANANDALVIDNRYGNVVVNTWDRNEFKVDVTVKITAGDQGGGQDMLDNISIADARDGAAVTFKTIIGAHKSNWFSMFTGNDNAGSKMEINYVVYMPAKNSLTIDNRYGRIILPDLDGKVTINSAYGGFSAKTLSSQSAIRVKYGTANIESLGAAALDVSYCTLDIGSVENLALNMSYGNGPVKISKISGTGSINIKYGDGLQIADIQKSMKSLVINSSYTNVSLGLNGDEDDNFDVSVHYGDFNYNNRNVIVTSKDPDDGRPHLSRNYKGYLGKGGAGKNIAINSSYGDVKFQ